MVINDYKMFVLPDNIGGRFSFITAAYLFDVYPFDQPGVEVYKSEISKNYN